MTSHLSKHLNTLTRVGATKGEPAVQTALQNVLESIGEVIREYQTGEGPCDLFLPARRVVIETKERSGKGKAPTAGPNLPGSKEGETQFHQLERYVLALRQKEQATLWGMLADNDTRWVGALTDGAHWWAWEWPTSDQGSFERPFPLLHEQSFEGTPDALREALEALATRGAGKPWVPANPADLFKPLREELTEVWAGAADNRSAETQHSLWYDLVRGSGIEVSAARRYSLFLDHCLLVTLARYVTRVLDGQLYAPPDDGFMAWIADAPGGDQWARDLFKIVDRYDWGSREADVLRNVYQEIVPKRDRKLYGEYYTPDWLAHLIVEETLDDEWLETAIRAAYGEGGPPAGVGVLDPTCGSGTFLFQAATRILSRIPLILPSADAETRAQITANLVHGFDIHPVAVEMARATLRRALPAPAQPSIHQGDALLIADRTRTDETMPLEDAASSELGCPQKCHSLRIPHALTDSADFPNRLKRLVQSARDGATLPRDVLRGLDAKPASAIEEAHKALSEIVRAHGDGVWTWYISNQSMPRSLARRKVDRIVSNPPWLRWNEIRTEPRKTDVRKMARSLGLLSNTQGGQSSFDIGALFVVETRTTYLRHPTRDRSAFVLNASALSAENWAEFRRHRHAHGVLDLRSRHVDGRILNSRPFSGAQACVVGMRNEKPERLVLRDNKVQFPGESARIPRGTVVRIPTLPEMPWASSFYAGRVRNGTTINPAILVRVDASDPSRTLKVRRRDPIWGRFSPFPLDDIPDEWRVEYVDGDNLAAFTIVRPLSVAIIPNENGSLLDDRSARAKSRDWTRVSRIYAENCGQGETTPRDLATKLNYRGQLDSQRPPSRWVVYNKSGQHLRAAISTEVIENKLYRVPVSSGWEAEYLVAILNAPALDVAFRQCRNTDRHFDKLPLTRVPIPQFDQFNADHASIVALSAAIQMRRVEQPDAPYPDAFRSELNALDEIVRRLFPDFCIETEDLQ